MIWEIISNKRQKLTERGLIIFILLCIPIFLPTLSYAVTKYQEIQPGKTTKDEVSGKLGEPKEINPTTYEYPSSHPKIEKVVIEYKIDGPTPIVDRIDIHFSKPVARGGQIKQMGLPDNPDSQKEGTEGNLQEYYGSTKSLILTYKGKTTESGIKTISFLSRDLFESIKPEPTSTPTVDGRKETPQPTLAPSPSTPAPGEVAITPEAKQHLQQGMTYVAIAQNNPKTASENYKNAESEFSNAIKLYPNYAEAYSNRGVAYMQQKKYNKAEVDLKKAAELKPKDPIIHYNLTALYSLQNKLDLALDELDKALEYGFDNYDALKPSGDHDLKNLRKDPEFRKVLEKHKVFILK